MTHYQVEILRVTSSSTSSSISSLAAITLRPGASGGQQQRSMRQVHRVVIIRFAGECGNVEGERNKTQQ